MGCLQMRISILDGSCEMCTRWKEDCYHAIMACPHAKGLRTAMRQVWKLPIMVPGFAWFVGCGGGGSACFDYVACMVSQELSINNSVDFLTSLANQLLMVNGHQGDGANAVWGRVREPTG
jgi:hypothetical protein